ncbi:MAG: TlpA family protein disulfide reductase [Dysgonamonadaceae bacterium]|jgi:thiol-disulfide isomerase/thioredoxin|nr:TlpA family protein disulfide reductase [Dysgonamonadaceae bacterium]
MTKKLIFCILLLAFGLTARAAQQKEYTVIKGKVLDENIKSLRLCKTIDGKTFPYATTNVAADGSYGFAFVPEASEFYTLGTTHFEHTVYVKAGDEINVNIAVDGAELTGTNSPENLALYRWLAAAQTVRTKATRIGNNSTFLDFFPDLEKLAAEKETIKASVNSGNNAFDALLRTKMDYDLDYYALMFLYTPRVKQPKKTDETPYYTTLVSENKFNTPAVLLFPEGMKLLGLYLMYNRINNGVNGTEPVSYDLPLIPEWQLKGEYVLNNYFGGLQTYEAYEEAMQMYGQYFITPKQKKRSEFIGSTLYQAEAGRQAADFTYPDGDGKLYSLADFKGKVVVVDLWATWCGPCLQQIPYMKKLEETMRGRDVVFVGISIDAEKDKALWKQMIADKQLPGIHLYAGVDSKITNDYKVNTIPRYLLFDKKGRVVTDNAPRFDNPELKKLLEKELAR